MSPKVVLAGLIPLLATSALAQPVAEGGRKFSTELTGEAEVNAAGVPNKGDLDGTGSASITVNVGQQRVCWDIDVAGVAPITRGHIHKAPATTTGAIVVGFFEANAVDLNGCTTTPIDRALLRDIIQNPQDYYVNVHNADFPAGALRGQLSK
ncbi:MAG: CHRD domain-containing protein [Sphingomonas sp.]|nr:CHRD domain-containing protein [Sphingomonas sp.]